MTICTCSVKTPQTHSDTSPLLDCHRSPFDGVTHLPWLFFFPLHVHSLCDTLCQVLGLQRERDRVPCGAGHSYRGQPQERGMLNKKGEAQRKYLVLPRALEA